MRHIADDYSEFQYNSVIFQKNVGIFGRISQLNAAGRLKQKSRPVWGH